MIDEIPGGNTLKFILGIFVIQKANQCHHLYRPSPGHSIGEKVLLA